MEELGNLSENNEHVEDANKSDKIRIDIVKESVPLTTLFIIVFILLFIIGVCGNSLVVYVVVRYKTMQSIANVFIANLAVSDVILCLIAVPVTAFTYFMGEWIFGGVCCYILPIVLNVCVFVSTLTLTAIADVRFFVVVYPLRPKLKICGCLVIIAAIWMISAAISSPAAIYKNVFEKHNRKYCIETWPNSGIELGYTVASLVLQYVVPCSIITYCYSNIFLALKARSEAIIGSGIVSREREETDIRRMKRTNKLLIAMIIIFVCGWLPSHFFHLTTGYSNFTLFFQNPYASLLFLISYIIALISTICNPFIYALMNDKFMQKILPWFVCRRDRD